MAMQIKEEISKHFDVIETVIIIGFAVGMVLMLQEIEYSKLVIKISLVVLAILYWIRSSERKEGQNIKEKISEKLMWYSLVITPIALLSKLEFKDNANVFLIVTMGLLLAAMIYRIYERLKSKNRVNMGEITRLIVAMILAFSLFALPV